MDPTPEQIRERCLKIQEKWSEFERRLRSGFRGETRNWRRCWTSRGWVRFSPWHLREYGWTPPQYLVHVTMIGQSDDRRSRELRVWDGVG